MNITILGGSGRMGQILIKQALSNKRKVTALVRRKGSLESLINGSNGLLSEIIGDSTNPQDISKAIKDADALVHVVSVPLFHKKPTYIYSNTTKAVIEVLENHKNIHYIVMSSAGTHHVRKSLPRGIRNIYEYLLGDVANDKEYEEQLLEKSTIDWTIIKSPFLITGPIQNTKIIQFRSYISSIFDKISRETIANIIINIITNKNHIMEKITPLVK